MPRRLGIDAQTFQRLLDGCADITPDIASRLEAADWSQASLWIDLQADFDTTTARRATVSDPSGQALAAFDSRLE